MTKHGSRAASLLFSRLQLAPKRPVSAATRQATSRPAEGNQVGSKGGATASKARDAFSEGRGGTHGSSKELTASSKHADVQS